MRLLTAQWHLCPAPAADVLNSRHCPHTYALCEWAIKPKWSCNSATRALTVKRACMLPHTHVLHETHPEQSRLHTTAVHNSSAAAVARIPRSCGRLCRCWHRHDNSVHSRSYTVGRDTRSWTVVIIKTTLRTLCTECSTHVSGSAAQAAMAGCAPGNGWKDVSARSNKQHVCRLSDRVEVNGSRTKQRVQQAVHAVQAQCQPRPCKRPKQHTGGRLGWQHG